MPYQVQKYLAHISGPILDRIDVVAETTVMKPMNTLRRENESDLTGLRMRDQVVMARNIQKRRYSELFGSAEGSWNGKLSGKEMEKICVLDTKAKKLISRLSDKYSLSGRAYCSLLKVSRTIADLESSEKIEEKHLAEATGYRMGFERYLHG